MNQYKCIAQVIRYLDEHQREQPDLAKLANVVGLSQSHFHRMFSTWAGITPKEFLQCLTLAHARDLLQQGQSVLNAAIGSGLSGPGRLHDLCVKLIAASPGEMKSGGKNWAISYGFTESPFGTCLIAENPRGICHLAFVESQHGLLELDLLKSSWPHARYHRDDTAASRLSDRIFELPIQSHARPMLRAYVQGTAFQVQVWRALLQLQAGTVVSYRELATALGKPAAARSVGTALAQNRVAYLIPCHRVIRETGVVSQYRWGRQRKQIMLAWESAVSRRAILQGGDRKSS